MTYKEKIEVIHLDDLKLIYKPKMEKPAVVANMIIMYGSCTHLYIGALRFKVHFREVSEDGTLSLYVREEHKMLIG